MEHNEQPRISAIAAIGENNELGKENDLLWRLPADFERMQEMTQGHALIMGRKTHESIGRTLPGRTNIVITRDETYEGLPGSVIVHSMDDALREAKAAEHTNEEKEVFIFGGAEIYNAFLPQTERLYLTQIEDTHAEADTFFPAHDEFTKEIASERHTDPDSSIAFRFVTLERDDDQSAV